MGSWSAYKRIFKGRGENIKISDFRMKKLSKT
jgi:hypothetical protein